MDPAAAQYTLSRGSLDWLAQMAPLLLFMAVCFVVGLIWFLQD